MSMWPLLLAYAVINQSDLDIKFMKQIIIKELEFVGGRL